MEKNLLSLRSLFVSVGSIQLASAALGTLVAFKVAEDGGNQSEASLVAAGYSLGFLIGCFYIFRPLGRIGYIRAFAAGAALCSLFTLLISATESTLVLIIARFITGLATAGLFAIGDAWINDTAAPSARGRVLSIYYVVLGLTSVMGQAFLVLYEGDMADAFIVMAALYNVAIVVLSSTRTEPPKLAEKVTLRIGSAFKEAPMAMIGAFTNGFILALLLNVIPFQASVDGLSSKTIAVLIGGLYLGRILFQIPLGRASDLIDRRIVIVGASLASSVLLCVLAITSQGEGFAVRGDAGPVAQMVSIGGAILLGGFLMPLYGLLVSHAMDRTVPVYVAATAVTLLFVYTLGTVVGPLVVSAVAVGAGNDALLWLCFGAMGATTLYSAARIATKDRTPPAEASTGIALFPTSVAMSPKEKHPS